MLLYSHNNQWPQELPFRIRLNDGLTRTDPETFTPEELAEWGYTGPYEKPDYDPKTQRLEWTGNAFIVIAIDS